MVQTPRPQLAASGTRLFIADGVVDGIDLALPGCPDTSPPTIESTHGSGWIPAGQIAVAGNRAWTTIGDFGIATFDAGTPRPATAPRHVEASPRPLHQHHQLAGRFPARHERPAG